MNNLTTADFQKISAWRIDQFAQAYRSLYIGIARFSYHTPGSPPPPKETVAAAVIVDVLFNKDFQKTLVARDPYLDVKDHSKNGAFYEKADLFARYFVHAEWPNIIR